MRQGCSPRGQRVSSTQRIASHANVPQAWLGAVSASHPSGTLGTNLELLISPSMRNEDSWTFRYMKISPFSFARRILPEPRPPLRFPPPRPREPPGYAMTIARGSCRRRFLRHRRMLHRVLPCSISCILISLWASRQVVQHYQHQSPQFYLALCARSVLLNKVNLC